MLTRRHRHAPVDIDFFAGHRAARCTRRRAACQSLGVITYDHDRDACPRPSSGTCCWGHGTPSPAVRFVLEDWPRMVEVSGPGPQLGVRIAPTRGSTALPDPPVIVATQLESAALLLDDPGLRWRAVAACARPRNFAGSPATWDAVRLWTRRGRRTVSAPTDPSLAPAGRSLVQATMPLRPGEPRPAAIGRLEGLLDLGFPGWRDRTDWRREGTASVRSGALDLPGYTWRDRPAIDGETGSSWPVIWWQRPGCAPRSRSTAPAGCRRALRPHPQDRFGEPGPTPGTGGDQGERSRHRVRAEQSIGHACRCARLC